MLITLDNGMQIEVDQDAESVARQFIQAGETTSTPLVLLTRAEPLIKGQEVYVSATRVLFVSDGSKGE